MLEALDTYGSASNSSSWAVERLAYIDPAPFETVSPLARIREQTQNEVRFNVMPDRVVQETLFIKEYRVWNHYLEAQFDREYVSQMKKSPDHLVFLSAQIHLQKMLYVFVSQKLGLEYDPFGPEKLKFWPVSLQIKIPTLIRKKTDLVHKMFVEKIEKRESGGGYMMQVSSKVEGLMEINGSGPFFILEKS